MSLAAIYLNAVLCTNAHHSDCKPAEFMWSAPEELVSTVRAQQCEVLASALNGAQDDKSTFYRCDFQKGG